MQRPHFKFKSTAQIMITNQSKFSCQSLSITGTDGEDTVYPLAEDITKFVKNLFLNELKPKPLNPKALEEMAKKQLNEIILVGIVPSTTHIHVGVSVPEAFAETFSAETFLKSALSSYNFTLDSTSNSMCFAQIEHHDSFKERDVVLRSFFDELRRRKIYVDKEEEEMVNYLE